MTGRHSIVALAGAGGGLAFAIVLSFWTNAGFTARDVSGSIRNKMPKHAANDPTIRRPAPAGRTYARIRLPGVLLSTGLNCVPQGKAATLFAGSRFHRFR